MEPSCTAVDLIATLEGAGAFDESHTCCSMGIKKRLGLQTA
jgi:hypothetical protein